MKASASKQARAQAIETGVTIAEGETIVLFKRDVKHGECGDLNRAVGKMDKIIFLFTWWIGRHVELQKLKTEAIVRTLTRQSWFNFEKKDLPQKTSHTSSKKFCRIMTSRAQCLRRHGSRGLTTNKQSHGLSAATPRIFTITARFLIWPTLIHVCVATGGDEIWTLNPVFHLLFPHSVLHCQSNPMCETISSRSSFSFTGQN